MLAAGASTLGLVDPRLGWRTVWACCLSCQSIGGARPRTRSVRCRRVLRGVSHRCRGRSRREPRSACSQQLKRPDAGCWSGRWACRERRSAWEAATAGPRFVRRLRPTVARQTGLRFRGVGTGVSSSRSRMEDLMSRRLVVAGLVRARNRRACGHRYGAVSRRCGGRAHEAQPAFQGYYDGHRDTYLSTDISSQGRGEVDAHQLLGQHRQPSRACPRSTSSRAARRPASSLFRLRAGRGGLLTSVDGDDPDLEARLDAGSDHQRQPDQQAREDERLTERPGHVVLNCPIIKVG